ncbi:MAG: DDE-type integrase/transposase/recombinase, partial [Pyrinomonadaceae bacterium]|nr:DDE-type integrase/transposase/recombinase [Pyrinomonadaceae bacterium]
MGKTRSSLCAAVKKTQTHGHTEKHATNDISRLTLSLPMEFLGTEVQAIVDTGSQVSLVRKAVLETLPAASVVRRVVKRTELQNASADSMLSEEMVTLRARVERHEPVEVDALVVDRLSTPMILGMDVLTKYGATIHVAQGRVELDTDTEERLGRVGDAEPSFFPDSPAGARVSLIDFSRESEGIIRISRVVDDNSSPEDDDDHIPDFRDFYAKQTPIPECVEKLLTTVPSHTLNVEQTATLKRMLTENGDALRPAPAELRRAHIPLFEIVTGNAPPVHSRGYRASEKIEAFMEETVAAMVKTGLARRSRSNYASPVVCPLKSDGSWRFAVDYRQLNGQTEADRYPLPRIDESLDTLQGAKYFSILDLKSGFWQVPVHENSVHKTAFVTRSGLYEFLVMPFGLRNAPAAFQRTMNDVLVGLIGKICACYIDDICIFSVTIEQHLERLAQVLERLRRVGMYVNLDKCQLFRKQIKFLGHIVSADGVRPDPAKTTAIEHFPAPGDVPAVRRFNGMVNYYRRFIPNLSAIAAPLNALTQKDKPWRWGEAEQKAFDTMKQALVHATTLALPVRNRPDLQYVVTTDASMNGIGASITQVVRKDTPHETSNTVGAPLAFFSRKLNPAERNYGTSEQECLALIAAVKHWRCYLEGEEFIIVTDHDCLRYYRDVTGASRRLQRWAIELSAYNCVVIHRPGWSNAVADALSRAPLINRPSMDTVDPGTSNITARVACQVVTQPQQSAGRSGDAGVEEQQKADKVKLSAALSGTSWTAEDVALAQRADAFCSAMTKWLTEGETDANSKVGPKVLAALEPNMRITHQGLLFHLYTPRVGRTSGAEPCWRLVLPQEGKWRTDALRWFHDDPLGGAHSSDERTYGKLRERFFWRGMYADVQRYTETCVDCLTRKSPTGVAPSGKMQPIITKKPFEIVAMDGYGPLPLSNKGNRYILTVGDLFTKYADAIPLPDLEAKTVAQALISRVILRHGAPDKILTDRGSNFNADLSTKIYELFNVKKTSTTAYNPRCDGQVERFHRTLADMLSMFVDKHTQADWDEYLEFVMHTYN